MKKIIVVGGLHVWVNKKRHWSINTAKVYHWRMHTHPLAPYSSQNDVLPQIGDLLKVETVDGLKEIVVVSVEDLTHADLDTQKRITDLRPIKQYVAPVSKNKYLQLRFNEFMQAYH